MFRPLLLLSTLPALLLTVPVAAAASCAPPTDSDAVVVGNGEAYVDTYADSWYPFVNARYVETWAESNGVPGLQKTGLRCPDGTLVPRDTLLAVVVAPTSTKLYL